MKEYSLKYKSSAKTWFEALPLGNGKLGAIVFSGIKEERIGLNLDTLWSGDGHYKGKEVEQSTWSEVHKSLIAKDYTRAEELVKDEVLCDWTEAFLPAGDIGIYFDGILDDVSEYKRELSLDEAVHSLSFVSAGKKYTREMFTSLDENVLVIKLSVKEGGSYCPFSFTINMTSQLKYEYEDCSDESIVLTGRAPVYAAPDYLPSDEPIRYEDDRGMRFALGLKLIQDGGNVRKKDDRLVVSSEGVSYIIFSGNTDFHLGEAYKNKTLEDIDRAVNLGYENLKSRHIAKYRELFSRVELSLSKGNESEKDETLDLFEQVDKKDTYLYELMFHYARYLMISSSMEGSEAANLQGIWNKDIRAPWSSNYTVNINTQMNYWFSESVNLPDCHMPLFDLLDRASLHGERTAKEMYNSSGWVSHHNIDIWGHSTPVGRGSVDELPQVFSMWQMSSGWFCRHLWEHYLHSLDKDFLRDRAYPLIKGAVDFYLDNLVEVDGRCGLIPSTSPENIFVAEDGKSHAMSYFSTMDIAILKELFSYYIEICEILGVEEDARLRSAFKKLPDFQITSKGCLAEWYFDYEEKDEHHRHVSHLYGLYPASLICDDDHLLESAKNSLNRRGDEGTGWAIAWRACLWARLKDGNRTLSLLSKQLNLTREERIMVLGGGTYPNLFCAHPPFQIDGNFGFAAAVVEMLVQSHAGYIDILPALPDAWTDGEAKGLILRGGYEADFKWRDGRLTEFKIRAKKDGKLRIKIDSEIKEVYLEAGKEYELSDI